MTSGPEIAFQALDARLDRRSPAPLAVAVSGGGDSMALLHLTHAWAAAHGRNLIVLTVDHRLNAESGRWAAGVAAAAAGLGRPCRVLSWDGPKPSGGLPAAARTARHGLLATAARAAGARVILLGHTADDRAEGDWMREAGSTLGQVRAWAPSPVWPDGRGLMLLRPLLDLRRADLRAWLAAQDVAWLEDPANLDPASLRVRARGALSGRRPPPAPEMAAPICDAGALFRDEEGSGALTAQRSALLDCADAHAALAALLVCAAGEERRPRGRLVSVLLERLQGGGQVRATLGGARIHATGSELRFGRDAGRRGLPIDAAVASRPMVWDGRFEITPEESGTVRAAAGLTPRLSREDQARVRSRPAWLRQTLPVLEGPSGAVTLPEARSLVGARLCAALGGVAKEADLPA